MANVQMKLPNGNNAYPTEEIVDFSSYVIKNPTHSNGIEITGATKYGRVCVLSIKIFPVEGNIPVGQWITSIFSIHDDRFKPEFDISCTSSQGNGGNIHLNTSAFLYYNGECNLQLPRGSTYVSGNYLMIYFTYISKA